jgi:hypothetical protein
VAPFTLDSFQGDVSLIGYSFDGKLTTQGDSSALNLVALGVQGITGRDYWVDHGPPAKAILSLSEWWQSASGAVPMPNVGQTTTETVKQAFSRIRRIRPLSYVRSRQS